jgi:predicted outer membrane repeat protein
MKATGKTIKLDMIMLNLTFIFACLLLIIPCQAKVIYVDSNANGANDGSSWADAFNYLQDALSAAQEYDNIFVAEGIYKPDESSTYPNGTGDRKATFQLINHVVVKGGYAGFGYPDPNARDINLYDTILNGDLMNNDMQLINPADMLLDPSRYDNTEHVVTGSGTDANTVLDGFTITAGYNGGMGGGMFNQYGSPTVTDCTFTWNCAEWGGGMCNLDSSPKVINCKFERNAASGGGGIDNVENSNPMLINCTFSDNFCWFIGGAMVNGYAGIGGSANPVLINCIFSGNSTDRYGGAMYNEDSSPKTANCTFNDNQAERGGAIYCQYGHLEILDCNIIGNSARYNGSAIFCWDSNAIITGCKITDNLAGSDGGGIYFYYSSPTITDCTITYNSSNRSGGGIYCEASNLIITDCIITSNSAMLGGGIFGCGGPIKNCTIIGNLSKRGGGLFYCWGPIINCTITNNSAGEGGGLAYCSGPITNCTITGNSANYGGGLSNCDGLITNCTITDNSASMHGGGLAYFGRGPIKNSIIWGNWPDQIFGSLISINYSDVQGGYDGPGNINTDPCFIESGYWADVNDPNIIVEPNDPNAVWLDGDYHLLPASPCINAGDPNYVPEPNETDLDGLPRVIGGRIDMGPYEFNHQPVAVAGPNQIVYAWLDDFADVNLDGSASYDDDNDMLDYYWSWTIGGNTFEANGVNPTIKLPVGIHTIELVVDDGIDLSESDYCTITVIKAVRGRLSLSPNVLQIKSRDKWLIATLFIPYVPGEKVNTSVPLRLYPSGIEAKYQHFSKYGRFGYSPTIAVAFFDKQQVIDALGPGRFEVDVVGEFLSGRFFFGSDSIKITTPKPPPKPWHW